MSIQETFKFWNLVRLILEVLRYYLYGKHSAVRCRYNTVWYDMDGIIDWISQLRNSTAATEAMYKPVFKLTKCIPFLTIKCDLWVFCWEDFGKRWQHYNTRTEINFDTLERLFAPTFEIKEQKWPSQELFLKPQSRYLVGLGSKTLLLDSIT